MYCVLRTLLGVRTRVYPSGSWIGLSNPHLAVNFSEQSLFVFSLFSVAICFCFFRALQIRHRLGPVGQQA